MYSLFTRQDKYNFTSQYGIVDYVWNISGLSIMAKTVYQVLLSELKYLNNTNKLKEDDKGIYVELARSVIGGLIDKCSHTVAKYIKELQRYGLLIDRRMGVNLCNRIYLRYRTDAKRYNIDKSENKNGQKNNDVKSANDTSSYENPLINKANDIIAQLTQESLPAQTINQMLILCNDNLDDLNAAVQDCFGHTPSKSYTAMIFDRLKNRYYEKKKERKSQQASSNESNTKPRKSKSSNGKFGKIYSHNWNLAEMEKAEMLYVRFQQGEISEEEYQSELNKIKIYNK